MPAPFSDSTLQTYSITDFTPGIHRWNRYGLGTNYPSGAPPGSAAHAYRCFARQEVGLLPAPTYTLAQTYTVTDPDNPLCISIGDMKSLSPRGGAVADIVTSFLVQHGTALAASTSFNITRLPVFFTTFTPVQVYNTGASDFPQNTTSWPSMCYSVWQDPTTQQFGRTILTTDPIYTSFHTGNPGRWVTVPGWTAPTLTTRPENSFGTFPLVGLIGSYPRAFYHDGYMGIWQIGSSGTVTNHFIASDSDILYTSGPLPYDPSTITEAGPLFPEMGTTVGAWGSWSTGELIGVYSEGGGFIAYGPLAALSSSYKLTGIMGTGGATGPMALTPVGAIYPRYNEGVYLWNGDNSSQSISTQIPDGQFTRTRQANGFAFSPVVNTSQAAWGDWVMFPNNWMLDTTAESWWLIEDPTLLNFQVHASYAGGSIIGGSSNLLSSPGIAYADAGEPATINTYYWTKSSGAQSYFWHSNPIPVTVGALTTISLVEIIASNPYPTAAKIVIQPTSPKAPALTYPFPNQNANIIFFDIPPNTSNFRAQKRLGYADYNIQLAITASNASNPAPTIHALNCSYSQTRTSGVT
jgi:hypothetical protein